MSSINTREVFEKGQYQLILRIKPENLRFTDKLIKAIILSRSCQYEEAIEIIAEIKSMEYKLDPYFHFMIYYTELLIYYQNNKFQLLQEKMIKIDELIQRENFTEKNVIHYQRYQVLKLSIKLSSKYDKELIDKLIDIVEKFRKHKLVYDEGICLRLLGKSMILSNDLNTSLKYLKQSHSIFKKLGNQYEIVETLVQIGAVYGRLQKWKEARKSLLKAEKISKKNDDIFELVGVYSNLSNIDRYYGDLNSALDHALKALQYSQRLNDEIKLSKVQTTLGNIYLLRGEIRNSMINFTDALTIKEREGKLPELALIYNNLGVLHRKRGEYHEALDYYLRSNNIFKTLETRRLIAISCYNISDIYLFIGKLDKSNQYLKDCIEYLDKDNNNSTYIKVISNLGKISLIQGDLNQAYTHLNTCLSYWEESENLLEKASIMQNIALIERYYGNYLKARTLLIDVYKIQEKMYDAISASDTLYYLILTLKELKLDSEANYYLNLIKQLSDQLDHKEIKVRALLSEIILLNNSDSLESKLKIKKLIDKILAENIDNFELVLLVNLNLCQYLLFEIKATENEESLKELSDLISYLYEIAYTQENSHLIVELLIIQVQMLINNHDFAMASFLLNEAKTLVESKKLDYLTVKVNLLSMKIDYDRSRAMIGDQEKSSDQSIDNMEYKTDEIETLIHDINNHLAAISGFTDLVRMENQLSEDFQGVIEGIDISNESIQMLVSNLIENRRIMSVEIKMEKINLSQLVILRNTIYQTILYQKRLAVIIEDTDFDYFAICDEKLFNRVYDNVFYNAIKYSPINGEIKIAFRQDERNTYIDISNDGPAISPEDQEKVFRRYEVLTTSKGFGIGLSFCRKALYKMQGEITLTSPLRGETHGVTFSIQLKKG